MSGIYLNSAINNQTYELLITSQAENSLSAPAKLSGIYSNVVGQHTVNFTLNENYGVITPPSITVPYGTTFSSSGNEMTFKYNGAVIETVTATPLNNTEQYTYSFGTWGTPTGEITGNTNITANFKRTLNQYTIIFETNESNFGSVSSEQVTLPYGTTLNIVNNVINYTNNSQNYSINAIANNGYEFDCWMNNNEIINESITINSNITITAIFKEIEQFTVTLVLNSTYGKLNYTSIVVPKGTTYKYIGVIFGTDLMEFNLPNGETIIVKHIEKTYDGRAVATTNGANPSNGTVNSDLNIVFSGTFAM